MKIKPKEFWATKRCRYYVPKDAILGRIPQQVRSLLRQGRTLSRLSRVGTNIRAISLAENHRLKGVEYNQSYFGQLESRATWKRRAKKTLKTVTGWTASKSLNNLVNTGRFSYDSWTVLNHAGRTFSIYRHRHSSNLHDLILYLTDTLRCLSRRTESVRFEI